MSDLCLHIGFDFQYNLIDKMFSYDLYIDDFIYYLKNKYIDILKDFLEIILCDKEYEDYLKNVLGLEDIEIKVLRENEFELLLDNSEGHFMSD